MSSIKKIATTSLFVAFASAALAQYSSPELMLVTDAGNGSSLHPAQVERYDPYSGAYLGAFGAGYLSDPYGATVIGSDAYITDLFSVGSTFYSRIVKFNFSTGAYDGTVFNSGPDQLTQITSYGGNLIASDLGSGSGNGRVWTLSPTGQFIQATSLPTASDALWGGAVVGAQYWGADENVSTLGGALLVYNLNADGSVSNFEGYIDYGLVFTSITTSQVNGSNFVYGSAVDQANNVEYLKKYDTSGNVVGSYQFGAGQASWSLAAGHNGIIYDFNRQGTVYRFDGGDSLSFGPLGSFALTNTYSGNTIAVYAAPEPVSMAFLGLGVIGLVLKRRRGRS